MSQRLVSARFPYLPLHVELGQQMLDLEALLDTGFDGDVALPTAFITGGSPDYFETWTLADGTDIVAPVFFATLDLPGFPGFPIAVTTLGDEPLVGRGVSDRFNVNLDHGQRVIVTP